MEEMDAATEASLREAAKLYIEMRLAAGATKRELLAECEVMAETSSVYALIGVRRRKA